MSKNIRSVSSRHTKNGTLFQALTDEQKETGKLTPEQLQKIGRERHISQATLLGTASFYDFLNVNNGNKRAYICTGSSCLLSAKSDHTRNSLSQRFTEAEIGEARCLGHCYHGGAWWEGDQTFDEDYLDSTEKPATNSIPYYCAAPDSLFNTEINSLDEFYTLALKTPQEIIRELKLSQLRGRGGAGFYFVDKLTACTDSAGGQKYIVCNADEGDPGAFSDRYLLEYQSHRVLLGMLASGIAVGADTGYLYIRAEYPRSQTCMAEAIKEFEKTEVYSRTGFKFHIVRGAGSYVCGEETALLNSIEGLRPEVRIRPPYPATEGLFGRPTLLSNVETLAAIPWILEHGGKAFSANGTEKSKGTKLLSLDSSFNNPGVHEVVMGITMNQVVYELGGGFKTEIKALQVGGPLGSIVPVGKIDELTIDFESFDKKGFLLGHAGIVGIPHNIPMIVFLRHLFTFMAEESCGKCLPCRLGTEKGSQMLKQVSENAPIESSVFNDLLETLELGSLCALGGGLPLPVRNIMKYFSNELTEYFTA